MAKPNRYQALIAKMFLDRYAPGATSFEFERSALVSAAADLAIDLPKNLGDVIYSVRFRTALPPEILATQPPGMEWIIEGAGRSSYRFRLVRINRIVPRSDLVRIAIPDATPELIRAYALDDEQALLAIIRYNRLIDTFLGLTTYSFRTTFERRSRASVRSKSTNSILVSTSGDATTLSRFRQRLGRTRSGLFSPSYSPNPARVASLGGFEAVGVLYPGL